MNDSLLGSHVALLTARLTALRATMCPGRKLMEKFSVAALRTSCLAVTHVNLLPEPCYAVCLDCCSSPSSWSMPSQPQTLTVLSVQMLVCDFWAGMAQDSSVHASPCLSRWQCVTACECVQARSRHSLLQRSPCEPLSGADICHFPAGIRHGHVTQRPAAPRPV